MNDGDNINGFLMSRFFFLLFLIVEFFFFFFLSHLMVALSVSKSFVDVSFATFFTNSTNIIIEKRIIKEILYFFDEFLYSKRKHHK